MSDIYRGLPEKRQKEGVFAYKQALVVAGDLVEATCNVMSIIPKGTRLRIASLLTGPQDTRRGFEGRLVFDEYPDQDFNAKKFRKIEE